VFLNGTLLCTTVSLPRLVGMHCAVVDVLAAPDLSCFSVLYAWPSNEQEKKNDDLINVGLACVATPVLRDCWQDMAELSQAADVLYGILDYLDALVKLKMKSQYPSLTIQSIPFCV
jgi:hypothetical protein